MLPRVLEASKEILYQLGLDHRARVEVSSFARGLLSGFDRIAHPAPRTADYLHIGCGYERLPGFVNCDRMTTPATDFVLDLVGPLPFADGSVKGIFHQHVFEHIDWPRGARHVLAESARVLVPRGHLRFGVPDLRRYVDAYLAGDKSFAATAGIGDVSTPAEILNYAFGHGHRFLYDYEALRFELERAGFRDVRRASHRDSADPMLNQDNPSAARLAETIFVEARR
jgi:predicted SAM-dependent methyltransferase